MALPRINIKNNFSREPIYKDFDAYFEKNLITNDIMRNLDEEAVKQSMKNILLTDRGSRVFNPYFGGNIRQYLFENKFSVALTKIVEEDVIRAINTFEPRVTLESVECVMPMDDNIMHIIISFFIINNEEMQTVTVKMEKVR